VGKLGMGATEEDKEEYTYREDVGHRMVNQSPNGDGGIQWIVGK